MLPARLSHSAQGPAGGRPWSLLAPGAASASRRPLRECRGTLSWRAFRLVDMSVRPLSPSGKCLCSKHSLSCAPLKRQVLSGQSWVPRRLGHCMGPALVPAWVSRTPASAVPMSLRPLYWLPRPAGGVWPHGLDTGRHGHVWPVLTLCTPSPGPGPA